MERPTEVPSGTYHWPIPRGTELKVDVAHDGKKHNRLVHLVWPHVVKGVEDVIAPGIGLRIVPPYLPYKNEEGEIEESELHDTQAFVWITGDLDSQAITFDHIWTLCYVFFTLWPGELAFILVVPEEAKHMHWVIQMVTSGLATQDHVLQGPDGDLYPDAENILWVRKRAFWQGAGAKAGVWAPILPIFFPNKLTHRLLLYCFPLSESDLAAKCKDASAFVELRDQILSVPFYERYIPEMDQILTFRLVDPQSEFDTRSFETWYLQPEFRSEWERLSSKINCFPKSWKNQLSKSDFFSLFCAFDNNAFAYIQVFDDIKVLDFAENIPSDWAMFSVITQDTFARDVRRVPIVVRSLIHMMFLLFPDTSCIATIRDAHDAVALEHLIAAGGHIDRVSIQNSLTKLLNSCYMREALIVFPRNRFFEYFTIGRAYIEGMVNREVPERSED